MKQRWKFLFAICALLWCLSTGVQAKESGTYCVLSQSDGRVLAGEGIHETQSVASISKIMTAVVALEHGNLQQTITIDAEMVQTDGSSIYLKAGEKRTVEELLYGLLLRSGNDAALALAKGIGGSVDTFVKWMNETAQKIGMTDSVFHNPSGLDEQDVGNQSSAYDMALLMRYAMQNDIFRTIDGAASYSHSGGGVWVNKNRLIRQYDACIGGKTGYTKKAGRTLVSSAKQDDLEVIVVTLQVADDFAFHQSCYEEAFAEYHAVPLLAKGRYTINGRTLSVPLDLSLCLKAGEEYYVKEQLNERGYALEVVVDHQTSRYEYAYGGEA